MSTQSYLAQFGVTMQQARDFIVNNINNPGTIFQVCKNAGITNSMIAEIVGGVTAVQVQQFFNDRGLQANQLDGGSSSPSSSSASSSLPTGLINLTPSQGSGALTTDQLNFITSLIEARSYSPTSFFTDGDTSTVYSANGLNHLRVYVDLYGQDQKDVLIALTANQLQQVQQRTQEFENYFENVLIPKHLSAADIAEIERIESQHPNGNSSQYFPQELVSKAQALETEMHQLCSNIVNATYQQVSHGQASAGWLIY